MDKQVLFFCNERSYRSKKGGREGGRKEQKRKKGGKQTEGE